MKKSASIFYACIFLITFFSYSNAQWVQTGPSGGFINKFYASGNKIYAAAYGGVLISTDYGLTWSHSNWGFLDGDVRSVVITSTKVYAGTYFSGVYLKDLNGLTWTQSSLTNQTISCLTAMGDNVFAGTYSSGVFLSTDNGSTWNQMNNGLTDYQVECFAVLGTKIFAGTSSQVFVSTDMGANWTSANKGLPNNDVITLAVNGTDLYSGVSGGGAYISTDEGQNWDQLGTCPTHYVYSFAFNGSKVYAAGQKVCVTSDGGVNWADISTYNTDGLPWTNIQAICYVGGNLVAGDNAVNVSSGIYVSSNEGSDWTSRNLGVPNYCANGIAANNDNIVIATGGGVFFSTNEGTEWNDPTMHGDHRWAEFSTVSFNKNNYAYAGDVNGFVYVSNDGGKEFTLLNQIEDGATVTSFAFLGTKVFASTKPNEADVAGGVYMSNDSGATWMPVVNGLPTIAQGNTNISALAAIGTYLFAGTGHGVFLSTNNGTDWSNINNGLSASEVYSLKVNGNDLFAGTDDGVFSTSNNGTIWKAVGTGLSSKILINYPIHSSSSGDNLNRAFYITDYPGTSLSKVTLYFSSTTSEAYTIQLQALNSTFDGTLIGQATASFSSSTSIYDHKAATFNFNNTPVTKGQIVAFKLSKVSGGSGSVYFCTIGDTGSTATKVFETEDTTPPLSTLRRRAIAIKVDSGLSTNVTSLAVIDTNIFAGTDGQGVFRFINNDSSWINAGMNGNYITAFAVVNDTLFAAANNNSVWKSRIPNLITDVKWTRNEIPGGFSLSQNYPNPFNPSTSIEFHIKEYGHVTLKVYDILGREITTLINENKPSGNYKIEFNARKLSSGIYFYKLQTNKYSETKKMMLLK